VYRVDTCIESISTEYFFSVCKCKRSILHVYSKYTVYVVYIVFE